MKRILHLKNLYVFNVFERHTTPKIEYNFFRKNTTCLKPYSLKAFSPRITFYNILPFIFVLLLTGLTTTPILAPHNNCNGDIIVHIILERHHHITKRNDS